MISRLFLVLSAVFTIPGAPAVAAELTVARLEASPSLDGPAAQGVALAPDAARVTFLQGREDDRRQMDLWEYRIADGERRLLVDSTALLGGTEQLDEVELARRERQRNFNKGITEYRFSPDGEALLFTLGGDVHYLPIGGDPRRLTDTEATETDARVSPAGGFVSFVREQNLYLIDLASGEETVVTRDGGGTVSYGAAEFVAQEEMYRFTGYWWSKDDRWLAFTRVDEVGVTLVDRYEIGAGGVTSVPQRYPFAGEANAEVRLFLLDRRSGDTREIDWRGAEDDYLVRVDFAPNGTLALQRQSRDQQRLDLVFVNPLTLEQALVLTERSQTWLNLHSDLTFFENDDRFLWTSERDGFRHLYLYRRDGTLERQLTDGAWALADTNRSGGAVRALDEARGQVWFLGHRETPIEQHLYRVDLDGASDPVRVTSEGGWHDAEVAPDASIFVDRGSAPDRPPYTAIRDRDGRRLAWILENPLDETHPYYPYLEGHRPSEFGTLTNDDGLDLHYELLRPAGFDPARRYPAVIHVYGGPGGASVERAWSIGFRQLLARKGFVVLTVDNRGTGRRGTAFDDPIYRRMGFPEVEDQVAGARWLGGQPWVDESRIGVYGWSYGGYMSLLCLFKAPEVFAAGVAGAPVVDWRLYDTHYTERYMAMPGQRLEGQDTYERSSPIAWVGGLADPLLLVHGMSDDNVVFDHSVRLMAALQQAGKPFELMTYPGKRHRITGEAERTHLYELHLDFFRRHLGAP